MTYTRKEVIGNATLYLGDCKEIMRDIPDNSVDSIVTDPPYGLSFMGKKWDYDVPGVDIWAECLRVLKPGGHLLAFAGTRTQHRMAVRIEDAGFEIRDMIAWVYGSGFNKVGYIKDGGGQHVRKGWGGSLKPALEPITVARKPLIGTVAANVLAHGTGALNIDGCRVEAEVGGRPLREVAALRDDVQYSGNALAGRVDGSLASSRAVGSTDLGRWPANLIHDGSDEVVAGFPQTTSGKPCGKRNATTGFSSGITSGAADLTGYGDTGSAARFFYCAKASKADRGAGNTHPTVKPTDLMAYLCRLVTPPGGVVLDPFMGSGSTGKAAVHEGFRFIGCEREIEYFDIACRRIEQAVAQGQLFAPGAAPQPQQLGLEDINA